MEQISFFDYEPLPGAYVKSHGREISFDEITQQVGQIIVLDRSTESNQWFEAVRVAEIYIYPGTGKRRLIYDDGTRQKGLIDETYFSSAYTGMFPARAYEP